MTNGVKGSALFVSMLILVAMPGRAAVGVKLSPTVASLAAGEALAFNFKVTGSSDQRVVWKVDGAAGGNTSRGTVSSGGVYTAPSVVMAPITGVVSAQSVADSTKTAEAAVSVRSGGVTPTVGVAVSPNSAVVPPGKSQQFTANVSGTTNTAVTWTVADIAGGNGAGTVSTSGLYTAPATVSSSTSVVVKAISKADGTKSAQASVSIPAVVVVSVAPASVSLAGGASQQFTAPVTGASNTAVKWSLSPAAGTITAGGLYTAPATVGSQSSVQVIATSAEDGSKSAAGSVTLIPPAPLTITTASLPGGTTQRAYSAGVAASGGAAPYTWSLIAGQLPPGITLATTSGILSGTPAAAGTYSMSIQVTDSARNQATVVLSLAVALCTGCSGQLTITTTSLPGGTVGMSYNATLAASGGTPPYKWSVASGQLPGGLSLSSSGTISGTPSASSAGTLLAVVTDTSSAANTTSKALSLTVSPTPATDQYGGLTALMSPGGKTGKWSVEKYPTRDGNGRWLITTPDGHGLWCGSQFAVAKPTDLNVAAKYGSELNWQSAALAHYTGWGFNCLAEYSDIGLISKISEGSLGRQVPFFFGDHFVLDAIYRRSMINGQVLPAEAVKDLSQTAALIANYTHEVADSLDPNLAPYIRNFVSARLAPANLAYDAYAKAMVSPWNMAMSIEDADYMYGFGPGPDECTTADSTYHAHIGWMALASPLNLYAQWYDMANPYNGWNWLFTDTKVYAKDSIVKFLKNTYDGDIGRLNAAWGSNYTGFESNAVRRTNEIVGTTDGAVGRLQHTLRQPGASPASLLIKVDGVPIATDPPRRRGTLVGRWPDGVTKLGGTIDYPTGVLILSSSGHTQFNLDSPGTTTWSAVNLGRANVVPGSIILRLMPNDCRITDDAGRDHTWQQYDAGLCGQVYTVAGSVDYTGGKISNFTISPAIPTGKQVQFQFDWTSPLPGNHLITVDYDVNGFGVGTTLADEDGSHTRWLGSTEGLLRKSAVPPAVSSDLNSWLSIYADRYYANTIDVIRPFFPGKLITGQMSGLGGHHGCPRKELALAAASHADFLPFSQVTQPLLDKLVTWGLDDKPIMDAWEGHVANAESRFGGNGPESADLYSTQTARGAGMGAKINQGLMGRGAGGTSYQIIGIKFWAYSDTTSESANFGLVSPIDNSYDGTEASTTMRACSAPLQSFLCGGELGNYGDAITAVRAALRSWPASMF